MYGRSFYLRIYCQFIFVFMSIGDIANKPCVRFFSFRRCCAHDSHFIVIIFCCCALCRSIRKVKRINIRILERQKGISWQKQYADLMPTFLLLCCLLLLHRWLGFKTHDVDVINLNLPKTRINLK